MNDRLRERLIDAATLADVEAAFTGTHGEFHWTASANLRGEDIVIVGTIYKGKDDIGRFARRLVYQKKSRIAIHEVMEIVDEHRDKGIGTQHYIKAFAFYEAHNYAKVLLKAESDGTVVWPQLGFDLADFQHKQRLLRILKDMKIQPLPEDPGSLFAPDVVRFEIDGELVGEGALDALEDRVGPIPMVFDFSDKAQRALLEKSAILKPRGTP